MSSNTAILLFRRDLRLRDNPALEAALSSGAKIAPLFILNDSDRFAPGRAARWWLHHSLESIGRDLLSAGATLILKRGAAGEILPEMARSLKANAVFWNRRYAPAHVAADKVLKARLSKYGVEAKSFSATLLREPWEVEKKSGGPFQVFTPFWKALSAEGPGRQPHSPPRRIDGAKAPSDRLEGWDLVPTGPDWASAFSEFWSPGERGARAALERFLEKGAASYARDRDLPDRAGTSALSPHLAFGEISPIEIWNAVEARVATGALSRTAADKFLSELGWREFSYSLLYNNDDLHSRPLRPEFEHFPWRDDHAGYKAWTKGRTGYPIVDAGMRQLWRYGWMHNRVRMIAASFLIKDLLVPWQKGAEWFWDTLVDADPANNSASWQWVAGSGADASPYFRIFNPVTQGEKFDPKGDYVRRFVPELAALPDGFIHRPWEASDGVLADAGVRLGETYPRPIVDHGFARKRALEAYGVAKRNLNARGS